MAVPSSVIVRDEFPDVCFPMRGRQVGIPYGRRDGRGRIDDTGRLVYMIGFQYLFHHADIGFGEFLANGLYTVFKGGVFQRCFVIEMKESGDCFRRISVTQLFYETYAKALKTKTLKMFLHFCPLEGRRFKSSLKLAYFAVETTFPAFKRFFALFFFAWSSSQTCVI